MQISEYVPTMLGRVRRVSFGGQSATIETATGRLVVLDRGDGNPVGLKAGQSVTIQNYDRNISLFGAWKEGDFSYTPPPAPRIIMTQPTAPKEEKPLPVRPPIKATPRAERFKSVELSTPFRDTAAEREARAQIIKEYTK